MKKCNKCLLFKSLDDFSNDASKKDGKRTICASCTSASHAIYAAAHQKDIKRKQKEWYQLHRPDILRKSSKHYRGNREAILENVKEYRIENRTTILKKKKSYYRKHKKAINQKIKKLHNLQKVRDPSYRALWNLRNRLYYAITRNGNFKSAHTLALLGCSRLDLKKHIESLFQSGMSWENYGQWHIDHIKPCKSFDLSCKEEQEKCFHFSNLQPLWASENLSKGCR